MRPDHLVGWASQMIEREPVKSKNRRLAKPFGTFVLSGGVENEAGRLAIEWKPALRCVAVRPPAGFAHCPHLILRSYLSSDSLVDH